MTTVPKAGWWPRAGAMLIDALIITAVALVAAIAMAAGGADQDDTTIGVYVAVFLATLVYSPLLMARPGRANGQTLGKQALRIRVVHAEGGEMTLSRGLMRDGVGKALLGIVPFYSIVDILVPLFDQNKQALHDKVGSTFVVLEDVPSPTAPSGLPTADVPHPAWSAPSQPVPPPPPPPRPAAAPAPPPPPPPDADPPDLGGFAPPVPPRPARPSGADEHDEPRARGPFGPSYGD